MKTKGKPRGRPKGWRKRSAEEENLTTIKVTYRIWEMLAAEKSKYPRDRMTDILSRILMERSERIKELEEEIQRLKAIMEQWKIEYAIIQEE
jgi:hypothetical protein